MDCDVVNSHLPNALQRPKYIPLHVVAQAVESKTDVDSGSVPQGERLRTERCRRESGNRFPARDHCVVRVGPWFMKMSTLGVP
jgi:hypothetical protein